MNTDNVKVIAILGKVLNEDGTPKDQLVKRCQLAAEMARSDPSALIVPSGGDPINIGITEAAVMSRILNEHGIGSHRIFLDELSKDTCENAYYTFKLVKERCNVDKDVSVTLVTSRYHMPRASWIFRVVAKAMQVNTCSF